MLVPNDRMGCLFSALITEFGSYESLFSNTFQNPCLPLSRCPWIHALTGLYDKLQPAPKKGKHVELFLFCPLCKIIIYCTFLVFAGIHEEEISQQALPSFSEEIPDLND